jgi:exonuclease III
MGTESILCWNVRGLNLNGRRDVVHDLVAVERLSIMCLQETKRDVFSDYGIMQLLRRGFDYYYLPTIQTRSGILLAWRSAYWSASSLSHRSYSLST